jgi:ubiquitin carboxyl-terminal hydrolase 4/11/15
MSLARCFEYFAAAEVLDEDNRWFCPFCREFVCATKKMDVWSVPPVLVIQIKRFLSGRATCSQKFGANIEFPSVLRMEQFCVGPQRKQMLTYSLFAVCEHSGGLAGGHYTAHAVVAPPDSDPRMGCWCSFNDAAVKKAKEKSVHSEAAYLLFYERGELANE